MLSTILKLLLTTAIPAILKYLKPSMISVMFSGLKTLLLRNWKAVLLILISLSAGFLIGWIYLPPEIQTKVQTETVTEFVTVDRVVEVMPALPECAGFDFDPAIGGMSGSELVGYTAKLYQWGAGCSSAVAAK